MGHRRKPVLQLSWGSLLTLGAGAIDRLFLITSCPHKCYSKLNKGTAAGNTVIDRLMTEISRSALRCYYQGIETQNHGTIRLVFLGLAGDHPFQVKVYRSLRTHVSLRICPWCHADRRLVPFEDIGQNAIWRGTVFESLPWNTSASPPLALLPGGDHPSFIKWDLMHMTAHGSWRNFCASIVCMMAGPLKLFPPEGEDEDKDECLQAAYLHFASWCNACGEHPRDLKDFTTDNLHWKLNRDFPDSNCKASDCLLLIRWLLDIIGTMPWRSDDALEFAYTGLQGAHQFHTLSYSGDRLFWNETTQRLGIKALADYLVSYKRLARLWYDRSWTLFNFTPKYHFCAHWHQQLFESIQQNRPWFVSPGAFSTPMAEDFVGLTSRISRTTHPSAVPVNTIRKYLAEVRRMWACNSKAR